MVILNCCSVFGNVFPDHHSAPQITCLDNSRDPTGTTGLSTYRQVER